MNAALLEIDSRVFGRNVLEIQHFDPAADFAAFERDYCERYRPRYVGVKIPLDQVGAAHALEDVGFRLVECQIRSRIRFRKPYDVPPTYRFEKVEREEDLAEVLEIAGSTFTHDRFSIDAAFDPAASGLRYREYVRKSFESSAESVYRLVEAATGRTLAFKTHRYVSPTEVLFLLGGVHPEYKAFGLGALNNFFEFNLLMRLGIKEGTTRISAANYPVFNLEIGGMGFRVLEVSAVLRKLY